MGTAESGGRISPGRRVRGCEGADTEAVGQWASLSVNAPPARKRTCRTHRPPPTQTPFPSLPCTDRPPSNLVNTQKRTHMTLPFLGSLASTPDSHHSPPFASRPPAPPVQTQSFHSFPVPIIPPHPPPPPTVPRSEHAAIHCPSLSHRCSYPYLYGDAHGMSTVQLHTMMPPIISQPTKRTHPPGPIPSLLPNKSHARLHTYIPTSSYQGIIAHHTTPYHPIPYRSGANRAAPSRPRPAHSQSDSVRDQPAFTRQHRSAPSAVYRPPSAALSPIVARASPALGAHNPTSSLSPTVIITIIAGPPRPTHCKLNAIILPIQYSPAPNHTQPPLRA
ncbi:hypothetical protein CALCODRAFT_499369 [Calocera cornea HHB12733]|uniref:Uncharacterized protein n=1 Tax=Calocera cornea HHB12733 TaxID=1353952 RepID=A0A165EFQ8_9BASI|nr:hypothetical protein CALCODRAFT_499369 [Calocera cornea HHB12733]